jgi:hypothetical protein
MGALLISVESFGFHRAPNSAGKMPRRKRAGGERRNTCINRAVRRANLKPESFFIVSLRLNALLSLFQTDKI